METGFSFIYNGVKKEFFAHGVYKIDNTLTVTAVFRDFKEYDASDWVLYFENTGDKDSFVISDICDCDSTLYLDTSAQKTPGFEPKLTDGDVCVISMTGCIDADLYCAGDNRLCAEEFGIHHNFLKDSDCRHFENTDYRSSDGLMPFFDITAYNEGVIMAIGWSGAWKADFTKISAGVNVKTGLKNTAFYLKPGEKIRTTSTLIMKYNKNEDKYNKFRGLIRNHFSHKACTNSDRDGILAFELWGGLASDEMIKRITKLKEYGIRFEELWIDAAWYGHSQNCLSAFEGDWSEKTGDWFVNKASHPDELNDVSKCAKEANMKLMLWVEPERVRRESEFYKLHPEWLLDQKDKNNNLILNYGNEEAFNYVYNTLSKFIEELDLSCYRQDFNTWLGGYFRYNDKENRIGITEIKHIMGMYKLWDLLLERFPSLIIDNCASGGRRIDIETLKRSIAFFRSDYQCNFNEDSDVLQTHNAGISKYIPFNGCTSKTKNDTYAARSSYSASWGGAFYSTLFQSMNEEDWVWARKTVDEYRRIRHYFPCEFYNHGSEIYDKSSWAIWQYHNSNTRSGIVMAFRRENSPFESVKIALKGIKENSKIKAENLNNGEVNEFQGEMQISLTEKRSSVIFEYTNVL